jgi:hypoxanthine phosphoribosyltransferase
MHGMKRRQNAELDFDAPTWDRIYAMLLDLAERISKTRFMPDVVLAVSRGGWIPARVLCDLLGEPNLADVGVEFYLGVSESKGEPTLVRPASAPLIGRKVLIVDEVADSGKSLKLARKHVVELGATMVKVAVIYCKPTSTIIPDFFAVKTSRWIIFPWEIKETVSKIIKDSAERRKSGKKQTAQLVKAGVPSGLVERFAKEALGEKKC